MREAIGGTWLFGLVITFIVFFASFLAVSINYAKAFNVKNNVVDLISKYEGNNCKARTKIGEYLKTDGYLVPGNCPSDDAYTYKGYDLSGNPVPEGKKAYYCVSKDSTDDTTVIEKQFYRVVVFFKFDLPMVGDLTTIRVKGETESIYFPKNEIDDVCS